MHGIWITWEKQRRNEGLSTALGWPLYEITHSGSRIKRYVYSITKTVILIREEKPRVVVAQNPSIILAFLVIILRCIFKYKAIIDAHNSGIYPMEGKNASMMVISRWLQRQADLTIVTNSQLKTFVESNGGRSFVLPDRLPDVPKTRRFPMQGRGVNIVFICTFSVDEPFQEVFHAARSLPEHVKIYVTGRYKGKVDEGTLPQNILLLGFVPDDQFWALLFTADIIMDLTLREGCLVCGAYEGVALGKPLILSDTMILRSYFTKGCVYVAPTATSIASGIMEAIDQRDQLSKESRELKNILTQSWDETFAVFKDCVRALFES